MTRKRPWFLLIGSIVALGLLVPAAGVASPGPKPKLDKSQLTKKACDDGRQIVNVEQKIVDDRDDGQGGNVWASTNYTRHIKVIQTGPDEFCAILKYEGKFTSIVGRVTPGATSTFTKAIKGEFDGGYRATFSGTFAPGAFPTHGNIGAFDYGCSGTFTCPGYVSWLPLYFPGADPGYGNTTGFDQPWWGWRYHAGKSGDWINSSDGNFGDITG